MYDNDADDDAAPHAVGRSFWDTEGEAARGRTGGGRRLIPAGMGSGGERLNGVLLPFKR